MRNNEKLFTAIENATLDGHNIRKKDLADFRGTDLNHRYSEIILKSIEIKDMEIYREMIEDDGIIFLRFEVEVQVAEDGVKLDWEPAVLWIGSDQFVELEGIELVAPYEFDFEVVEDLLARLNIEY